MERLLTVAEAAERLGLHPETVYKAVRTGRLACYRLQGAIRIAPEHLSDYLAANLCPAHSPAVVAAPRTDVPSPIAQFQAKRRFQRAIERTSQR